MMTGPMLLLALAALVPAFAASRLGVRLKERINEQTFRLTVLVTILVVSSCGLVRHLLG
jgi:uncharacterized membrane protein YfcA